MIACTPTKSSEYLSVLAYNAWEEVKKADAACGNLAAAACCAANCSGVSVGPLAATWVARSSCSRATYFCSGVKVP